jgi:hypothetical protein
MKKCLKYLLLMVTVIFITVSDYQTAFAETYTEGVDDQNLDFFYRNYTLNGKQVVYNDEKQMYFFQTENKTKVSNVYYHTIAWEFSRTLPGTKEYYTDASGNREYVMFNIGYLHEIEYNKKNGTTIATYMLQLDDVLNTIRAKDQGWYDEIMELKDNNITAYMMVDAVIQIIRVDADGDKHVSGYITGGQYKGDLYFHENYKELNKTFTNKKVQDGIETHYNIDVSIGEPREEIKIEDDTKEEVPSTVAKMIIKKDYTDTNMSVNTTDSLYGGDTYASPTVYTYNASNKFDLTNGIPTTEDYVNGIDVSSWYGHIGIAKVEQTYPVTVDYSVTVNYPVTVNGTYHADTNLGGQTKETEAGTITYGNGTWNGEEWEGSTTTTQNQVAVYTGKYTYEFKNTYYSIYEMKLFEFLNASVYNESVGRTDYEIYPDIQYNVTIYADDAQSSNGTKNASSADESYFSNWKYTVSYPVESDPHVTLPEISDSDKTLSATLDYESKPSSTEIKEYAVEQINNRFSDRILAVKNDNLTLNGRTYMTDSDISFTFQNGTQMSVGAEPNDYINYQTNPSAEQTVNIPEDKANGTYYTSISAKYKYIGAMTGTYSLPTIEDTATDLTYNAIWGETDHIVNDGRTYKQNEPVVVHSPIISPFNITIPNETHAEMQTQTTQSDAVGAQMILDNDYSLNFKWQQYFTMKGYDMPAGWTKYVKTKFVRFPFSVEVNGKYYEIKRDDITAGSAHVNDDDANEEYPTDAGYTAWIDIGAVESIDFYLPTWATEGIYGSTSATDQARYDYNNLPVQVKCFANNYVKDMGQIGEEYEANVTKIDGTTYNYVATYDYPVQISGVIYDMTSISVNDESYFGDIERKTGVWQFFRKLQDKKLGYSNRFGGNATRYFFTGDVETTWNYANTLPFTTGKSNALKEMGYLIKGNKFGFVLRTIGNLNGTNDTIVVKPTYRYIDENGNVYEPGTFNLYYTDKPDWYIPLYGDKDKEHMKSVAMGDQYCDMDLYQYRNYDMNQFTADTYGKTWNNVVQSDTESFSAGGITLYSTQKLLSGDEEQLEANQYKSATDVDRYNKGLGNISSAQYTMFKKSMQTWFGEYQVPNNLYVSYVDANTGKDAYQTAMEEGEAVNDLSDCWKDGGYLVLNFEIITYRDGNEHLHYYVNNDLSGKWLNMWTREQGNMPSITTVRSGRAVNDIQLRTGDVAVINMTRRYSDRYEAGVLYIN